MINKRYFSSECCKCHDLVTSEDFQNYEEEFPFDMCDSCIQYQKETKQEYILKNINSFCKNKL